MDPASKKAEIRARRFGVRDKTKKLAAAAATPSGDSGPTAALATVGSVVSGDAPAAQSLEALTRRAEAVVEDLERTNAGLVELEAEEAEEALLEGGGGDGATTADPLDMFMTENRKKERQQAVLRLTAKRESLREEQARLKLMVEAAKPSMPSLKKTPAQTADAGSLKKDVVSGSKTGDLSSETGPAIIHGSGCAAGGGKSGRGSGPKAPEERRGEKKEEEEEEEEANEDKLPSSPVPAVSMPAPGVIPRRSAATKGQDVHEAVQREVKQGHPDDPTAQKQPEKVSGAKRRGTPVGASMLPPPPSKRPERNQESLSTKRSPVSGGDTSGDGNSAAVPPSEPKVKRFVKGPSAMPPPSGWKPSSTAASGSVPTGKVVGSRGVAAAGAGTKAAGKDVLEGGDVDWVPPKDAKKKMAALNEKFGY